MTAASFDDIAVALKLQANLAADHALDLEIVCYRISLTNSAVRNVVQPRKLQAELVAEAYRIIRALSPVENTIRAIISAGEGVR
jgi:hypothetical protein